MKKSPRWPTLAARNQQDQPGEQEVAEQEEAPAPAEEGLPAAALRDLLPNVDIMRAVFFDWHSGQETSLFSCME